MPVFSSGQSALQAPDTFAALHSTDLIYCCGGGVISHPDGVAAGVQSLIDAWDAAEDHARDRLALAHALEAYGPGAGGS